MRNSMTVKLNKHFENADILPTSVKRSILMRGVNFIKGYFRVGGTPKGQWESISYRNGQVLLDTGNLMKNVVGQLSGDKMVISNKTVYAGIHNFGGKVQKVVTVKKHDRKIKTAFGKTIKPRSVTISQHTRNVNFTMPKREFMILPDNFGEIAQTEITAYSDWINK